MSIDVKGLNELSKKLEKLANLDKKPILNTIGNMVSNNIEKSFENETSPFGQKWAALKPSTAQQKEKSGLSSKILRKSGDLADKWIVSADNKSVSVSNNANKSGFAYGLTHQFGTSSARRNKNVVIPARPFLPVDKNDKLEPNLKEDILNTVSNHIKDILKGS